MLYYAMLCYGGSGVPSFAMLCYTRATLEQKATAARLRRSDVIRYTEPAAPAELGAHALL